MRATVILDEASAVLAARVGAFATVVLFSPSQGWNANVVDAVAELRNLVDRTPRSGPLVYVASSLGAFTALSFAHRHPDVGAAMVLLEPSHPRQGTSALAILDGETVPLTPEVAELRRFFASTNEASESGARELAAIEDLGSTPLLIVAAGALAFPEAIPRPVQARLIADRQSMLAEYGRLSARSSFLVVPDAGHGLAHEAPEAVTAMIRGWL